MSPMLVINALLKKKGQALKKMFYNCNYVKRQFYREIIVTPDV